MDEKKSFPNGSWENWDDRDRIEYLRSELKRLQSWMMDLEGNCQECHGPTANWKKPMSFAWSVYIDNGFDPLTGHFSHCKYAQTRD